MITNGGFFIKQVFQLSSVTLVTFCGPRSAEDCLNDTTLPHSELLPGIFFQSVSYPQFHHNYLPGSLSSQTHAHTHTKDLCSKGVYN